MEWILRILQGLQGNPTIPVLFVFAGLVCILLTLFSIKWNETTITPSVGKGWSSAIGIILLLCGTLITLSPLPNPASTQQSLQYIRLGGLDLDPYCRSLGHMQVISDGNSPRDWRCVDQTGTHRSIDLTKVCQWQYHRNDTVAAIYDDTTPGGSLCLIPDLPSHFSSS
jgi:hypothetical protein